MDVRIGVTYSTREIEVDLREDTDADAVQKVVDSALSKDSNALWLTDRKGRRVGVPSDKIAYVEIGGSGSQARMGFVS